MKAKFYLKGFVGMMILTVIAIGCKKEEVTPEFEKLTFDGQEVMDKLPAGLTSSTDQYAQECVSMIESALDMSDFIDQMVVPDNARQSAKKGSGDEWSWTWSYGGETWTFYWSYEEDNSKKYWAMDIQYGGGPRYDYIDAWEMKDGSQGEVVYNFNWVGLYGGYAEEDYVDLYWKYTWRLDSSGTYNFTWTYDADDAEHEYFLQYDIVVNSDGSGKVDYYLLDVLFYHMEWDANGAGSWIYYLGDLETSGTWPAA